MATANQSVAALIELARDASAPIAERHYAFGQVVRLFEDLAYACACARLHDPTLAEDAAQDAFLVAWQHLDQLREPAAFPGWLRRLVLTQCYRRLRGIRLDLRPEDEARDVAAPEDPAANAESTENATLLRRALAQLAPADRLVLILFYGSERSHAEIASWLGVPATTIARRLAHARRRLRRHTVDALAGGLRAQRTDAGEAFIMEFSSRFRRANPDDAPALADLATHLDIDRAHRMVPPAGPGAYLVEDPASETPIAYAAASQTIYKPIYDLHLAIGDEALKRHAGDVLLAQVVQDVVASSAIALQHRISTRHSALVEFLVSRGFEVSERTQDWRLAGGATNSLAALKPPHSTWEFKGLEALSEQPRLFDAALELLTDTVAEAPGGHALLPIHPDTLRRNLRAQRDGLLALDGGSLQGLITSSRDDVVPDAARLNILLIRKNRRRQGLATVLLARLLAGQGAVPARLVTTENPELTQWLTWCGFARVEDTLLLERLLRKTVRVSPAHLDEFVGRYLSDAMPDRPIIIERHGSSLVSKSHDMRDLLLAASETEFFTRHHYGRGRFERDPTGRVARLVYTEGPREIVAIRMEQFSGR